MEPVTNPLAHFGMCLGDWQALNVMCIDVQVDAHQESGPTTRNPESSSTAWRDGRGVADSCRPPAVGAAKGAGAIEAER
jgi:hypothetical protein